MTWFMNMKIGAKLISGFILVALIAGALGVWAIINVQTLSNSGDILYNNMTVPISLMSDISTDFQRIRVNVRNMILSNDTAEIQSYSKQIETLSGNIDKYSTEFEKTILSDKMRQAFTDFKKADADFDAQVKIIAQLTLENKDAEVIAMMAENGSSGIASRNEQNAITNIIDLKVADAKARAEDNLQQAATTLQITLIIVGAALVLSIFIGILLSRIISKPVKRAAAMIDEMGKGHLGTRLNIKSHDEVGMMARSMDSFAEYLQGTVVGSMAKISAGDVSVEITETDKDDEISPALQNMVKTIRSLLDDTGKLIVATQEGKLDTRGDPKKYEGSWKDLVVQINGLIDAFVAPINVTAEYIDRISKGDIPPKITDTYNGDFNEIKNNLNMCIDAVNMLVADANMLSKAAVEGKLDTRADASKHGGDFARIVDGVNKTLDSVIGPLNVAAEYVDRISKGDIPPKITDSYNGDFNEIKNNLNMCIEAVNRLVADANMLSKAAVEGKLDTRADASKHGGDFARIVDGVNKTLDSVIGPLNVAAEYVDRISKGDIPPKITDSYNGDFNEIKNNLNTCIDAVNMLVADANMLSKAAVEGKLDTRADASKHGGDFARIVDGVNKTLDSVIGPLNVAAEYVDRISKGDIPPKITDSYNGDFNEIKNNLNTCIDAVNMLVADANMLSKAAVEGKLDTRADASKHGGDFARIVDGVNKTLDSVIGPLNVAAEYVDRISKGDIPPKITDSYNGDFNEIKNNLNMCIEAVNRLVADANMLSKAAVEGKLDTRADSSKHGGDFARIVDGVNKTLDSVIGPLNVAAEYVDRISKGDIPPKITDSYNGDFNAIKNNLNTCIDAVNMLVADANMLSRAAVEGKLDTRADASKHGGDFARIVDGVNNTLDSVIVPLNEAAAVLQQMSQGNLHVSVKGDYKGDNAKLKNTLNETISTLLSYVSEIASVLEDVSGGNLDVGITADYRGDFVVIKDSLNNIVTSFNDIFVDINSAAEQVLSGAKQMSDGSQSLAQGATEQASSIQELSASITDISSQTKLNATNADEASRHTTSCKEGAIKGNEQMQAMLGSMAEINTSSSNISKIIKVIDDIAFQTNILALNAAVEAARAGQAGKGFAVVAEEVRSLAAKSASAAKETTAMIESSVISVSQGTKIANETAEFLSGIVTDIENAANLVGSIAQASNDQALQIAQINEGIDQVSQVVATSSATAEESAASSEELSSQAEMLKGLVNRFRLKGSGSIRERKVVNENRAYVAGTKDFSRGPKRATISLGEGDYGKY